MPPRALRQGESPKCWSVLPARLLPPLLLVPLQPQPGHPGEQGPLDRVDQAVQGAGVTERLRYQESVEVYIWTKIFGKVCTKIFGKVCTKIFRKVCTKIFDIGQQLRPVRRSSEPVN